MSDQTDAIPEQKELERKMARIRERLAWRPEPRDAAEEDAPSGPDARVKPS